ncbi:MAG: hypothetical protein EXS30_11140 [Pedosphaera sp.]|nr:hypothetical protein [Pedosphaera sp.]
MKHLLKLGLFVSLFIVPSANVWSDDLAKLEGKWVVKKTNGDGQAFTQIVEIKKDKFTLSIVGSDGKVRLYAEGALKLAKLGSFNSIQFLNIKAGASELDLQPIDDDHISIYMLEEGSWTVASNFDKDRGDQKPSLDTYKKVQK